MGFGDGYMVYFAMPILFAFAGICALVLNALGVTLWCAVLLALAFNGWLGFKLWHHFESKSEEEK